MLGIKVIWLGETWHGMAWHRLKHQVVMDRFLDTYTYQFRVTKDEERLRLRLSILNALSPLMPRARLSFPVG
jgi:hypothetical protein